MLFSLFPRHAIFSHCPYACSLESFDRSSIYLSGNFYLLLVEFLFKKII